MTYQNYADLSTKELSEELDFVDKDIEHYTSSLARLKKALKQKMALRKELLSCLTNKKSSLTDLK